MLIGLPRLRRCDQRDAACRSHNLRRVLDKTPAHPSALVGSLDCEVGKVTAIAKVREGSRIVQQIT